MASILALTRRAATCSEALVRLARWPRRSSDRREARARRARPRRQGGRPGAARCGLRGHLHRAAPDARADRRDRDPGGRGRRRAVVPLGGAHDALPAGRRAAPCARRRRGPGVRRRHHPRRRHPEARERRHREDLHARRLHGRYRRLAPRTARPRRRTDPGGTWISTNTRQGRLPLARDPTPRGIVAATPRTGRRDRELGGRSVVKVQVQIGGRGKGGGVVLVDSPERAAEEAGRMFRDGFKGHGGEPRPRRGAAPDRPGVLHVVRAGSFDAATTWR